MGVSISTALEIFTNPGDLEIRVGQKNTGEKFAIGIFRGPGHNFKLMLSSQPFAETFEDAIEAVRGTLEAIREAMIIHLADRTSLASQYLNPDGQEIDERKVLNPDLIDRILAELRHHKVASTYKMLAAAG